MIKETRDRNLKNELSDLPITLFCIHGNHEARPWEAGGNYEEISWNGGLVYEEEGKTIRLYDEVPAMLYHIYQKESLGRFFLGENGETDRKKWKNGSVESIWIITENCYAGRRCFWKRLVLRCQYGAH